MQVLREDVQGLSERLAREWEEKLQKSFAEDVEEDPYYAWLQEEIGGSSVKSYPSSPEGLDYVRPPSRRGRNLEKPMSDDANWGDGFEYIPALGSDGDWKICTKCKWPRQRKHFAKDSRNKDGIHSWCVFCHREHKRLTYEKSKGRQ